MVDGVSASVCPGRRQGTRRRRQMAAVEPERPTEKGHGPAGGRARGNKRSTGISRQARSSKKEESSPAATGPGRAEKQARLEMPTAEPEGESVIAAKQVFLAGPASEPGGARQVGGSLAGPTSEPVRARLEWSMLAIPSASRTCPSPLACCFTLSASGPPVHSSSIIYP